MEESTRCPHPASRGCPPWTRAVVPNGADLRALAAQLTREPALPQGPQRAGTSPGSRFAWQEGAWWGRRGEGTGYSPGSYTFPPGAPVVIAGLGSETERGPWPGWHCRPCPPTVWWCCCCSSQVRPRQRPAGFALCPALFPLAPALALSNPLLPHTCRLRSPSHCPGAWGCAPCQPSRWAQGSEAPAPLPPGGVRLSEA